ncbi:MATE family efflux transporter [Psychroflexus salinarum]|uniref:MATE family efflux transporter n=1 Tax=Psychroflexus salinarum TaxID=546024 RepID=A0ABW3GLX6_9FLAO
MFDNKLIAKNTIFLYVRMLIVLVVSLYTSRIVLIELGVEDYGIYSVVGGVVMFFGFLNGAMVAGTQRFLSFEIGRNDFSRLKETFNAALLIHIFLAFTILILAETVGLWFVRFYLKIPSNRIDAALFVYHFSVFSFVVSIIKVPYNAIIIARERMYAFAYFGVFEMVLKLIAVFLLIWFSYDKLKLYSFLLFIVSIIVALVYLIFAKRNFSETNFKLIRKRHIYKELINYSGWNLLGSFSMISKGQGINILSNIFFGTTVNAAYAISNQIYNSVYSFVSNFQMASNPQIISNYASGNIYDMLDLVRRTSKFSFYLIFILTLPFILEIKFILNLWLDVVPEYTVIFTILILMNSWIDSFSSPLVTLIQATGRIKFYQIFIATIFTLNVPIAYLLFKFGFPPESAFISIIFINFVALGTRLIFVKKNVPEFSILEFLKDILWRNIPVILLSASIPIIFKSIFESNSLFQTLINMLISFILSMTFVYFIGLKNNERKFVKSLLINFINKN